LTHFSARPAVLAVCHWIVFWGFLNSTFCVHRLELSPIQNVKTLRMPTEQDHCPSAVQNSWYSASSCTFHHSHDQLPSDLPYGYSHPRKDIYTLSQVGTEQRAQNNLIWRLCVICIVKHTYHTIETSQWSACLGCQSVLMAVE